MSYFGAWGTAAEVTGGYGLRKNLSPFAVASKFQQRSTDGSSLFAAQKRSPVSILGGDLMLESKSEGRNTPLKIAAYMLRKKTEVVKKPSMPIVLRPSILREQLALSYAKAQHFIKTDQLWSDLAHRHWVPRFFAIKSE